jgi:endonuclease/exonuclease/phosphatase family metal-dependent hydrolase
MAGGVFAPSVRTGDGMPITVCQWNIHKCTGSDNVRKESRTGDALVKLVQQRGVSLFAMNEVYFNWAGAPNQAEYLRNYLQQRTGATWNKHSYNAYNLTGTAGYGGTLLTTLPLETRSIGPLPAGQNKRGYWQAGIRVNGVLVNFFGSHFEYYDALARTKETTEMLRVMGLFAEPRVFLGDINSRPGEKDFTTIKNAGYRDAWAEGKAAGVAWAWNTSGNTHGFGSGSRFDYVWLRGSKLHIAKVVVLDMRVSGIWPSDHHPLVVTLDVA